MKRTFNLLKLILLVALFTIQLEQTQAQSGGLQLLSIGPDPVALSLSEAITARSSFGASIFTNPANLANSEYFVAGASHTFWLENAGNTYFSLVAPSRFGTFGIGILNSSIGSIEARQRPGQPSGNFDVNYYAFSGAFARSFGPISVGLTGMFLYEQLYDLWASGYAVSGGLTGEFLDGRLRAGTAILNYGEMDFLAETKSPLPYMIKSGVWMQLFQLSTIGSSEIPIIGALSIDFSKPLNDEGASDGATVVFDPWFSTGIEVTVSDLISLRGGIRTGETRRRFSTGIGILQGGLSFDYAYVPFETGFGVTHSISVTYSFQ